MISARLFAALAVAAMISMTAAGYAYYANQQWQPAEVEGERLLPDLVDRINDVARLTVAEGGNILTFYREDGVWRVAERSGYPASAERVRDTLVALASARKLAARTADPARYAALGLDMHDAAGDGAVMLALADSAGEPLASVIAGKIRRDAAGIGDDGTYVRLNGDRQSWLVSGRLARDAKITSWVDTAILDFPAYSVTETVIGQPDGSEIVLVRTDERDGDRPIYRVADLPENRETLGESTVRFAAVDFATLSFVDVRSADMLKDGELAGAARIAFDTGLVLELELIEIADAKWLKVSVAADGDDEPIANAMRARTDGWRFRLETREARAFSRQLDDLTRVIETVENGADTDTGDGAEGNAEVN